jgi:hypothetical protein
MMETLRLVWLAPDGTVRVSVPATPRLSGEEADAAYIARVAARLQEATPSLAVCTLAAVVKEKELPSARFRNAWRVRGSAVVVDLDAARTLLEAEVPLRRRASPAKVARIRAAEVWRTPLGRLPPRADGGESGEDF